MSRNRVEDLESRVSELEATVRGLTEELVEANERLRVLEAHVDVDAVDAAVTAGPEPDDGTDQIDRSETEVNSPKSDEPLSEDENETESESDDIIVA